MFSLNVNRLSFSAFRCGRKLHIVRTVDEMRKVHKEIIKSSSLGFVPTMGALHSGHIMLMNRAKKENEFVTASIFVNPTQFSAGEDLDKYPRQFEADCKRLAEAKVDFVFAPTRDEMYKNNSLCHVEPLAFNSILEGKARPEFFRGVATVVCKLFNIVDPTKSYFGQKDISQCILIRKLVEDLSMKVSVVVCETIREQDGLALSSRNAYLSDVERQQSSVLYRALNAGKSACRAGELTDRNFIVKCVEDVLKTCPLVNRIEYISVASHINMIELDSVKLETGAVLSAAIRLGNVRLIDNLLIGNAEADILN
jgi:pantoate--beta-alanine ligase